MWEKLLACHPDQEFSRYICDGVREGFRVGFNYRYSKCLPRSSNMKSVKDHKEVVDEYIQLEREVRRLIGPLDRKLFLWVLLVLSQRVI